jgi:hypothetical protein
MTPDELAEMLDDPCWRCGRVLRWCECGNIGPARWVPEDAVFDYADDWLDAVGDTGEHRQTVGRIYAAWLRAQATRR